MRWVNDGGWVMPKDNPGIRIEPNFVSEAEAAALGSELLDAASAFGYPYEGDARAHIVSASGEVEATLDNLVNNMRVTGRLEKPDVQKMPPWGYGDAFDAGALPPALGRLAERIATCGAFRVGKPRDATINVRDNSFFYLSPHVDPPTDGPDVFIVGLESSVVLTFSPPEAELSRLGLGPRTTDASEVGLRSWSPRDIDVLVQPRSLVHFSGPARDAWAHAIRAGVQLDGSENSSSSGGGGSGSSSSAEGAASAPPPATRCDWWGQTDYLVRRNPRRLSVVLAFGAPDAGV